MQPERLTARFQEQGARGRERNRTSKSNPTAAVTIAYLSELYSLPRHLSIESDVRSEQLLAVVMYYLEKTVSDPEYDLTTDEIGPPFVRRGRVSSTRGLTDVGLEACGVPASPVLSKRHSGDTPAVSLAAAQAEASAGGSADKAARYRLYKEAVGYMRALGAQYDDGGKLVDRLIGELRLLHAAASASEAKLNAHVDLDDRASWEALAMRVLKSAYLHEQVVGATDALEMRAAALNARMPGAPFGEEHELLPLGQLVLDEYPVLATILQMQWGRPPLEGQPLGRIRASTSQLAAKGRAARTQYKPKAARRGAAAAAPDAAAASALMALAAYSDDDEGGAESGGGVGGASYAAARSIATPWRAPPSTAYELFARAEAARRLGVPGRTDRLGVADWEAITRAWLALSDEQRRHQQASFEAAASIGLAQGARGSCAYLCHRGRAEELLACNDCGSSVRCGHAACFAGRCEELDVNPSDAFLCPTCLQAHAEAVGLEPRVDVSEELLDAIELLVGATPLSQQLRKAGSAVADAAGGADDACKDLLHQHVLALRLVGTMARLCSSAGYAVAQGACARLACIEHLRAVPPDVAGAAAVCDSFRRANGLHVDAQYAAVLSMERLLLAARGSSRSALAAELRSREFDAREVERHVLRFVRDDACNVMQLQLASLVDEGAREEEEEEAQGGEEASVVATPQPRGRDRARRLAESLLVLAELRWIGSQKACPELKKLMGRVNRFYEVRGV
jgi:hypothetical protein